MLNFLGWCFGELELAVGRCLWPIINPYEEPVTEQLWRGSAMCRSRYDDLARRGFLFTVSFCAEDSLGDNKFYKANGPLTVWLPVLDNTVPNRSQVELFLQLLEKHPESLVYCHCNEGKGRTGVFVACERIALEGWSNLSALMEAEQRGLKMPCQKQFILEYKR